MDIQTRKIEFVQEFLKLQNEELIVLLDDLLRSKKSTSSNNIVPMTAEELNARVDKSMEDSRTKRITSSKKLRAEIEQWDQRFFGLIFQKMS